MSQTSEGQARRERIAFWAALFGLWLLFFVQAWNTPVLLDDWYQLPYWRKHAFGLGAIWDYGHYNYFNFNPRIGDVFLLVINGPPAAHLILTPLVEVGVLLVVFAIAFGRWPRATYRDLQLLLVIQVLIWVIIPIPGIIYFYRPFATNYLWAFGITRYCCSSRIGLPSEAMEAAWGLGQGAVRPTSRERGARRSTAAGGGSPPRCSSSAGPPACATSTRARPRWSRSRSSSSSRGSGSSCARG
jgi:Family of unknown function (DUF6056)